MQSTQIKEDFDSAYLKILSRVQHLCTSRKHLTSQGFEFQIPLVVLTQRKVTEAVTRELLKLVVKNSQNTGSVRLVKRSLSFRPATKAPLDKY